MIPGSPFDPATETSRRPTPERFAHLRTWIDVEEKSIDITNIANLKNINLQLEQTSKLYASNIISRVIAQLIGAYGAGFVTLEATSDGKLKVETDISAGATVGIDAGSNLIGKIQLDTGTASIGYLAAGANVIGKVLVQGHAETILSAPITISGDQVHDIIAADGTKQHHICSIMFTVAGDVTITLRDETDLLSGAMNLGGTGEAMGMCHTHDLAPLICHAGEKFQITLDAAVQVSGYVTYYSK